MSDAKIDITLPLETTYTLNDGKKIRIVKTKKESFLAPFQYKDSVSNKIAMGIAEDPVLLKFLFLRSKSTPRFYGSLETTVTFPLVLEPGYNFKKNLENREDYQRRNEQLEKMLEINKNEMQVVWNNMTQEFFGIVAEQPRIHQLLKSRSPKSFDDLTLEIVKIAKENSDMKEYAKNNMQTIGMYAYEAETLSKIKEFSDLSVYAQQNCALLNSSLKLPDNKDQLCASLAILAKHTDFSIEALCLDCWYEHRHFPFTLKISRAKTVDLSTNCQTCSGNGIVYKTSFVFPSEMNSLLSEDNSWAYEVFVGHAVANCDFIKKIYAHKKIQPYDKAGKVQSGVEVDIIAITNDDKLVIIEVTKQHDKNNILENMDTKIKVLSEYNIPYHKLIYVTASDADNYYVISKHNAIFALKHLTNLKYFIEQFVVEDK